MKRIYFGLFIWMTFISCGLNECDEGKRAAAGGSEARFSIVNWNVQTFFDGKTDGNEYKEYKSAEKWSNDKYIARLSRLCDVLTSINADICVLEEIENEGVIYDISNQLAGKSWDSRNNWNYSCFSNE